MLTAACLLAAAARGDTQGGAAPPLVGAYFFDGWSGRSRSAGDPGEPWARDAPTHLTRRLVDEFPEREPVWGWRDDSPAAMERQIDLAADHGVAFFAFCWYWHDDGQPLNEQAVREDPKHTSLELFLKAKNNRRMRFCLLVANHGGYQIKGSGNWQRAGEFWMPLFTHRQHLTVGGRPLVIIFNSTGGDRDGFAAIQQTARRAGLPGLAIAGCGEPPADAGYTHRTHYNVVPGYPDGAAGHAYADLTAANRAQWRGSPAQPCLPIVTAGWDKRPWEGPAGLGQPPGCYFPDRTPEQFAQCVRAAAEWMDQHPEQTTAERIVLVYAWNEFGEGGYIAPTKGDPGGSYLKALRTLTLPDAPPATPDAPEATPGTSPGQ